MKQSDKIELIPVGQPVGPLKWQMSLNGGAPSNGKYPPVVVKYGDTDDITFTIRHPGSITFAQQDAFCAQLGTGKPQVCDTKDFSFTGGGTTKLVVHDNNGTAGDYYYVINFNDGTPQLDPIIKNGGGGTGIVSNMSLSTETFVEIAGAIVLAALVIYLGRQMFMRTPPNTPKGP